MIHLYRVAGLRANEGIGPCDDAGVFPSVGAAISRPRSIIFILLEKMGEFVQEKMRIRPFIMRDKRCSPRGRLIAAPTEGKCKNSEAPGESVLCTFSPGAFSVAIPFSRRADTIRPYGLIPWFFFIWAAISRLPFFHGMSPDTSCNPLSRRREECGYCSERPCFSSHLAGLPSMYAQVSS